MSWLVNPVSLPELRLSQLQRQLTTKSPEPTIVDQERMQ